MSKSTPISLSILGGVSLWCNTMKDMKCEMLTSSAPFELEEQKTMNIGYDELYHALEESLKLQAHYAELLNMHDGGQRMIFKTINEWVARLRKTSNK